MVLGGTTYLDAELCVSCNTQTRHPRFQKGNLEKNKVFYRRVAQLAEKHGCTPGQLALAWLLHQGDDVVPIPGKRGHPFVFGLTTEKEDCMLMEV